MVYGPMDRPSLIMTMSPFSENGGSRSVDVVKCHSFPVTDPAGLMITKITDMIQSIDGSLGKDFCDAFMVMPQADVESPWASGFGCGSWVLSYQKGHDYNLYAIKRTGLYDWYEPGGRWLTWLKAKDPLIGDAHMGHFQPLNIAEIVSGTHTHPRGQEWSSLAIQDVDWDTMAKAIPEFERESVEERNKLKEMGIEIPTFREYFHILNPGLVDRVGPGNVDGYLLSRKFDTYMKYREFIEELRIKHKMPPRPMFSLEPFRWSNALLERLGPVRVKTLSCWIVGGVVYDLDDDTQSEEHLIQGIDALEALPPETIVSVVDVHY